MFLIKGSVNSKLKIAFDYKVTATVILRQQVNVCLTTQYKVIQDKQSDRL